MNLSIEILIYRIFEQNAVTMVDSHATFGGFFVSGVLDVARGLTARVFQLFFEEQRYLWVQGTFVVKQIELTPAWL